MPLGRDGNQRAPYQANNPLLGRNGAMPAASAAQMPQQPAPSPLAGPSQAGPNGMPLRPDFQSILGKSGYLQAPFKAGVSTMSTDMSPWLGLQDQRIDSDLAKSSDQIARDTNQALGSNLSSLATSGGLDSGARERAMTATNMGRMMGLQGAGQQATSSRLDSQLQAEMMKKQAEQFNAGAQNQNSMFNASNAISGRMGQNAFNSEMYGQDMTAWGAGKTADAAMAAAKKKDPGLFGINHAWQGIADANPFKKDSGWNF